jgi:hypothetical protein
MTRCPILNACIALERAEADLADAQRRVDTKAIRLATQALRAARNAVLAAGVE